jgi:hypothetical protein
MGARRFSPSVSGTAQQNGQRNLLELEPMHVRAKYSFSFQSLLLKSASLSKLSGVIITANF